MNGGLSRGVTYDWPRSVRNCLLPGESTTGFWYISFRKHGEQSKAMKVKNWKRLKKKGFVFYVLPKKSVVLCMYTGRFSRSSFWRVYILVFSPEKSTKSEKQKILSECKHYINTGSLTDMEYMYFKIPSALVFDLHRCHIDLQTFIFHHVLFLFTVESHLETCTCICFAWYLLW